jgi:hypothetical protein
MGGGFPNGVAGHTTPTSATASGAEMLVDYVRVFTAGGSVTPTPSLQRGSGNKLPGGGYQLYRWHHSHPCQHH